MRIVVLKCVVVFVNAFDAGKVDGKREREKVASHVAWVAVTLLLTSKNSWNCTTTFKPLRRFTLSSLALFTLMNSNLSSDLDELTSSDEEYTEKPKKSKARPAASKSADGYDIRGVLAAPRAVTHSCLSLHGTQ
jgi:hypothetical protein